MVDLIGEIIDRLIKIVMQWFVVKMQLLNPFG